MVANLYYSMKICNGKSVPLHDNTEIHINVSTLDNFNIVMNCYQTF